MKRRDALVIFGAMGGAIAIPPILRRIPSDFNFEPLRGFEGFRSMSGGAVSGGVDPFFGLSAASDEAPTVATDPKISPCFELFGPTGWPDERVPVAIFSDFNCPYCKVLERNLINLRDSGAPIRLIWHEMPLLGPSSTRYAQAVLAAGFLGKSDKARRLLNESPLRPGPVALRQLAQKLELPEDMFLREVHGERVERAMKRSLSLGRRLGIPGTPGIVVGRTLVIGAISTPDLQKLIKIEGNELQSICV
ncbi:MAG: DsbA family protein [Roseobacter sp.]